MKPPAKGWNLHTDGGTSLADVTSQGSAGQQVPHVGDEAPSAYEVQ